MYHYKTVVTDYEGMQEALSTYGGQGYKLISVTPDTWRITLGKVAGDDIFGLSEIAPAPGSAHPSKPTAGPGAPALAPGSGSELSASYYLLVFEREGELEHGRALEAATESLGYTLPEY